MMKKLLLIVTGLLIPLASFAGGGYIITESGAPSEWDNSSSIRIHPESGACGSFTNTQMLTKLDDNLGFWLDLSDVNLDFVVTSGSIGGVDGCNYGTYLVGVDGASNVGISDGLNPVLFDNDGEIVAAVAGTSNKFRVLGFANPSGFANNYAEIVDGQAVFNCRCLPGNTNGACTSGSSTIEFTEDELNFTMVHELGHMLNLDHTQVNANLVDGSADDDTYIPTMYPVSENAAAQISPMQDDIVALGTIYPSSTFTSTYCRVTGTLLDSSGNRLRCADVQAKTSDNADSVAFVSGAYAPAVDNNDDGDTADSGECTSNCGDFQLYLTPGKSYTISVKTINSTFTGGSGISPCANDQTEPCSSADTGESCIEDQDIATVTSSQCTAGGTLALGNIPTLSRVVSSSSLSAFLENDFENEITPAEIPRVLGGPRHSRNATTSCPESASSTTSSSSSSGSSSSGCSLDNSASHSWTPFVFLGLVWLMLRILKRSKQIF